MNNDERRAVFIDLQNFICSQPAEHADRQAALCWLDQLVEPAIEKETEVIIYINGRKLNEHNSIELINEFTDAVGGQYEYTTSDDIGDYAEAIRTEIIRRMK